MVAFKEDNQRGGGPFGGCCIHPDQRWGGLSQSVCVEMESRKCPEGGPYQADCQWGMPRNEGGARLCGSGLKDGRFAVLGEYEEVDRATEPGDGLGFAPGV